MTMSKIRQLFLLLVVLFCIALFAAPVMAAGTPTTQLHIVKYANDGSTVINETTKTYQWMEANLPVLGDGTTHYYHQGPVFVDDADPQVEQDLRWNPDEDTNVQENDNGAVKGTNLKDICDLVGGMNAGETVKLKASDNFSKTFAFENVYNYPERQGPMGITWYQNGAYPDGAYSSGMKLVFFADNSTNPWGINAMGNYDWHESAASQYWYYYTSGAEQYPTTTGLSVKYISDVLIYSDDAPPTPVVDTIYDGTVTLTPGETFTKQAYNNATGGLYTINRTTPLGALDKVTTSLGLTVNVTDKRWSYDQDLLLDDIGNYLNKKPNIWYAYVNGVYKDGYGNHTNGLNVIELANNDQVNFYYAPSKDPNPVVNATAVVKIKANIGTQPSAPDWTLSLSGAKSTTVSQTLFEQGLACPSSGHQVFWNDTDGNTWGGVPLWLLVSMVDDNPDVGSDHFNFNDSIAAQGYSIKVSSGDGWDTTLASQAIARNNSYIVANTLNGEPLPWNTTAGKRSWPLHLKGAAVFGGQQVGNITKIELTGLPQPPTEWKLVLEGDVTDTITQSYFIEAIACHHNVTWTDTATGTVWEGVSLWDLAGAVDDIETSNHFTFNDTRATMGYTIRVSAVDGFNATFASAAVAHNDSYIVAYKMNGIPLTGTAAPLKLVGSATTSNKQRVGGITKISLEGLPDQYPAGNWQLKMVGKISDVIPQGEFEYSTDCHEASYTDTTTGNVYTGIPLWRLMGWVDDRIPHGPDGFNDAAAIAGYKVIVKAGDGYAKEFTSQQIGKNDNFIIANTMNGAPLPTDGSHPPYPLRLVGSGATGGNSVGNVVEIQLTDFQTPVEAPKLHIIKYGTDGITVINETYVDYTFLESNMPVIGDGTTAYKFEGLTLNSSNVWDSEETYPGGFKVSNVVKGTRVRDLADLVGGMDSGTTITFVASDNFETTLPYSSIYTNPAVQERQGDAFIAWWGDGQYVPAYADGMRLFFTSGEDHVYSHWDMHETLPSQYWRYNFQDGVQYPSSAGLSAKFVTTIKVYSTPESDWTLELDGRDIGGIAYNVSKPFLEEAIACQQGAEHKATYTDSKGRVWEGMPLWFFAGFVDDGDQHSSNAYNITKAMDGYNILITGKDGYTTTIPSQNIIHSGNYLIANSLNGSHIDEIDENWPLRFTGANVNGSMTVKGVASIKLIRLPKPSVANFTATPVSGTVPLSVQFADASAGAITSYLWTFGDGAISTEQNPSHQYTSIGNYTVSLNVTGPAGSNTKTMTDYISVSKAVSPVAWFSGTPTTGIVPLTVGFTDETMGTVTSYLWTFGDGSTSTEKNPSHQYNATGTYTVKLTVTNSAGSNTITRQKYITVSKVPLPAAGFTGTPTTGIVPLTVGFTDASTGSIISYLWTFGDGSTSTEQNPSHEYTTPGTYTVKLKVTGLGGSNTITRQSYITASKVPLPAAGFTGTPTTGIVPLTVGFTDASTGSITSYLWTFGDGITSTEQSPSHTYTKAGSYTVKLKVSGPGGSNTTTKQSYIIVSKVPLPAAGFTGTPITGPSPLTVVFSNESTGDILSYKWTFGDGTISTEPSPSHIYTKAGRYTVKLTVTNTGGSNTMTKTNYIVVVK
jgi:PKD repeat protein/DMSO/TMAO reductase YedYZ molybdopterin-dependent catalytic subunit